MPAKENDVTRANLDKRTARKLYREEFIDQIAYLRSNLSIPNTSLESDSHLNVAIRVRPLFPNEIKDGAFDMVSVVDPYILVHDCRMHADMRHMFIDTSKFTFNKVFDTESSNEDIYSLTARPMLSPVLSGHGNCTFIMYGQTGTGKTYTMSGIEDLMISDIFGIPDIKRGIVQMSICAFEMNGNKCLDLLNNKQEVFLREGEDKQIHIRGVTYFPVVTSKDLQQYIEFARDERTTSSTKMNEQSSRTHCIVRIHFDCKAWVKECTLTLVDLAGSEMSTDSMYHTADQRREGAEINKSLMSLKDCIRSSSEGSSHVPYRSHKLTMLLKDCFEGAGHSTLLIATVAPNPKDTEHTINTLRSAAAMNRTDRFIIEEKVEVDTSRNDQSLIPPIRFTPPQLREWMATTSKCRFAPYVSNLSSSIDGKMFIRFNESMMKEICNGDAKMADLLRKEFNKAIDQEKELKKHKQEKNRQQNVRDKLTKAKAI